jgi:hypothetical protein
MKSVHGVSTWQRLGYWLGKAWRWQQRFERRVAQRVELAGFSTGKMLIQYVFLIAKVALIGSLMLFSFWLFVTVAIIAARLWVRVNAGCQCLPKDFLWHQAYGDPYGEYELERVPGQSDLDEK